MNVRSRPLAALLLLLMASLAACSDSSRDEDDAAQDEAYAAAMETEHAADTAEPSGMAEMAAAVELGAIEPVATLSEEVEYGLVNGQPVTGYLSYPADAHGGLPGIIVFHEWWGLNDNVRDMSDRLAAQGYVVLAVDLFDDRVADTPVAAGAMMKEVLAAEAEVNDNIRQAYRFITEEIGALSVASLGWCLGGTMSMNAALQFPEQLAGAVIYYGFVTGVTPSQLASLDMPLLGFFGAEDQGVPVEGVRQLRDTLANLGKNAEIVIYDGAGHAFANPTGQNFQPEAAADAWERTLVFLDRNLNAAVNRNIIEESPESAAPEEDEAQPAADPAG
ncbi:MAG: dienelactone hydrolase family protein [Gammaproteobacteria bacterium]|nr:dienelactone hydrolase family protein [Gammaproteobacteria bacterium]